MTKTTPTTYWTKSSVQVVVSSDEERLLSPWSVGRPEGWKIDTATKDTICVGYWLDEQLAKIANDTDRKTQMQFFNRRSRSEEDKFAIAAELLNEVIAGTVPQNRTPHKRWG